MNILGLCKQQQQQPESNIAHVHLYKFFLLLHLETDRTREGDRKHFIY